jgi:hypothetical protein
MPFHSTSVVSGSVASVTSTFALGACGRWESGSAVGPINGPSQWLWGEAEAYTKEPTWRHTATGYLIHHAMAILWANVYEELQSRSQSNSVASTCANAAIVSAMGYVVDYGVAPKRLRPGFKKHLGPASIFCVYASFGVGLALATWLSSPRRVRSSDEVTV